MERYAVSPDSLSAPRPFTAGSRRRGPWLRGLLIVVTAMAPGCRQVEFFERERLGNPIMQLADSPTETSFMQKTYYSREGSVGGFGTSAGGGCGCY